MSRPVRSLVALLLLCGVSVTGCDNGNAHAESRVGGDPAVVTPVDGPGHLHRITLSSDAAERIGLRTETVRTLAGGAELLVALAAVLYDQDGATWVYAETGQLSFQRVPVVVTRVDGQLAVLRSGPAAGTAVASVGAAELRGSEDGVPGE